MSFLKTISPFIHQAAALGGPFGQMAADLVMQKLGVETIEPTQEGIEAAVTAAQAKDPNALLKLKEADQSFQEKMAELGYDSLEKLEAIAAGDRDSARKREIAIRDSTPSRLAYLTLGAFFGLLGLMAFHEIPPGSHDIILAMTGALGGAYLTQQTYYFGSSASSRAKDATIANLKTQ